MNAVLVLDNSSAKGVRAIEAVLHGVWREYEKAYLRILPLELAGLRVFSEVEVKNLATQRREDEGESKNRISKEERYSK